MIMHVRHLAEDFKAFALKGNVLDFVMAVVIGGSLGRIISACVDGLLMPTFAYWLRETQWEQWTYWQWRIGSVLSALVDFVAKVFVMYLLLRKWVSLHPKEEPMGEPSAPIRTCSFCKETIHPEAIRCRHCGSDLELRPQV